jgi:hypothetical protein
VLAHLQRRGLLHARAGPHGGYALARPVAAITLLEVIEAMEGPLQTSTCVLRDGACDAGGACLLHDAWGAAQEALRTALSRTTLADAPRGARPGTDPRRPVVPLVGEDLPLRLDRPEGGPDHGGRSPSPGARVTRPSARDRGDDSERSARR